MSRMAQQSPVQPLLIMALLLLWCGTGWAGDEEMMNPYQTFDPETGFFIDDPERKPAMHAEDPDSGIERASESGPSASSGGGPPASRITTWWVGGLLLLAVAGFFIFRSAMARSRPR